MPNLNKLQPSGLCVQAQLHLARAACAPALAPTSYIATMGSTASTVPTPTRPSAVLPHALKLPLFNKLASARVVLASSSPRRIEILRTFGLNPEVVPSTFPEKLSHGDYPDAGQYAVATATAKVRVHARWAETGNADAVSGCREWRCMSDWCCRIRRTRRSL